MKKLRKYLLLHHPLLWNIRIVPAFLAAVCLHIIFFMLGLVDGKIVFSNEEEYDFSTDAGVIITFSVLASLLFFVIWLIFYLRNNAFKSFYPVENASLLKEWLLIALICLLNVTYSGSFIIGKALMRRSYLPEQTAYNRASVINMASIFISGGFMGPNESADDQITYGKKKYPARSLMNRSLSDYNLSINPGDEVRVKGWMQLNDQAAIKKLMRDYFSLIREHNLPTNLTPDTWFALTYHYPVFSEYELIGRRSPKNIETAEGRAIPTEGYSYTWFVPHYSLVSAYSKMSDAWDKPLIDDGLIYFYLYFSLAIAMLIFSYKVTNGRTLLFSLITVAVLWIAVGILSTIFSSGLAFQIFWLAAALLFLLFFLRAVAAQRSKGWSGFALNLLLWAIPAVLAIIYSLTMECFDQSNPIYRGGKLVYVNTVGYYWLKRNVDVFAFINVFAIVVIMAFLMRAIRSWKALADS